MYIPCFQPSKGIEQDKEEINELINQLRHQGYGLNNLLITSKRKYSIAEST